MAKPGPSRGVVATPPSNSPKARPGKKKMPALEDRTLPSLDFPVVGIGCSAGGLEALDAFLAHLPPDTGMAFVIIQHLDPNYVSTLPELLQRSTRMPVVEAADRLLVKPNSIYIIPPNKDIALHQGRLHLQAPTERRGLRLPVDFFFRSLAEAQREKAVGVILSGMGSDGMLGLGAIKEASGLAVVQAPATAKADSMPNSAIKTGIVDIVAAPEELPARIISYLQLTPRSMPLDLLPESGAHSSLERVIALLRNRTGNDFSLYKPAPSIGALNGARRCCRLTGLPVTRSTCVKTRRRLTCSSGNC